ncbi:MAG: hypothetical protein IKY09_02720 [Methanocorpusculum sp.]|nr:hypothetical protein [Methanocorpusculum sp.]MBR5450581.1 hypothetical protein [Methanocorpusculum sp.]
MTEELIKAKVETMEKDISEIKQDLKNLPEQIANKINENVDMKIRLAISETEKKYQAKFIGMLLAIIGEAAGLIISFIK